MKMNIVSYSIDYLMGYFRNITKFTAYVFIKCLNTNYSIHLLVKNDCISEVRMQIAYTTRC